MRRGKDRVLFKDGCLTVTSQAEPEVWRFQTLGMEPQVLLTRGQVLVLAALLLADAAAIGPLRIEPA